ncbi:MAG: tRNA lysidine(34) synthetase TilS [Bacteroidaceae bacterium]|nr:tRNA lysidine(34) synthetase TilS [Bacteroidaceae bacterium]
MKLPDILSLLTTDSKSPLWLVALSGGADSVALSLMMKHSGIDVRALHCNFHLRGEESDRDEQFVRDFCQQNHIPLDVIHFDTSAEAQEHKESIEMAARRLRYTWFAQRAQELHAAGICVAHHMDDQAETILLNLVRGTGAKGLQGMQADRMIGNLRIVRPLLNITRHDILQYLASHNQSYVTDSTNLEHQALRNRIRLEVIPLLRELNPNITQTLVRMADNLRHDLERDQESQYFQRLQPLGFTRAQIMDITSHHDSDNSGKVWSSATHTATLKDGKLIIVANTSDNTLPELCIQEVSDAIFQKGIAYIDADTVQLPLTLRRMQAGDRFRPYGMHSGSKLVSDYLTDRKVNILEKQRQVVVTDSTGAIVWVAPREIDDRYRITTKTTHILKLSLK